MGKTIVSTELHIKVLFGRDLISLKYVLLTKKKPYKEINPHITS